MSPDTDANAAYDAEGIRLFNDRQYWHAHEAWEYCWRNTSGHTAERYKGLIQMAAALVHWQRGNQRGLLLNWAKARGRLIDQLQFDPLRLGEAIMAVDALCGHPDGEPPVLLPHETEDTGRADNDTI